MGMSKFAPENRKKIPVLWGTLAMLFVLACGKDFAFAQELPSDGAGGRPETAATIAAPQSWEGKRVLRIEFAGVEASRLDPLPAQLAQQPLTPLNSEQVAQSLRRLYATGLYDSISAEGRLEGGETP